ncbi:gamma-glutamylcyclotransferase [Oricola sp.]|uniref:gamma-glutamylcyclotransferase n=1 Tax=Oricola sp. TaxID=1979950 RepID=UPI003BAD5B57
MAVTETADPFIHHPVLRDLITDPERSFFRTFDPASLDAQMMAQGLPATWRYSDAEREAIRRETLAGRLDKDIWVFAYGSLMWNPGFKFAEVRRARVAGYERRFCLKDTRGGRGNRDAPGLMAALDTGDHCNGLVFRIAAASADAETEILFRREMLAGSYLARFVTAETDHGPVEAVAFIANHDSDFICDNISRDDEVRFIATGTGRLGSSLEYLENLAEHFTVMKIDDEHVSTLLAEVRAYRATMA